MAPLTMAPVTPGNASAPVLSPACFPALFPLLAAMRVGPTLSLPYFNNFPDTWEANPYWMKRLPDSTDLHSLSIPGTHETLSLHGGSTTICQSWNLAQQLHMGIRYIDIRLRLCESGLIAQHGPIYQNTTFFETCDILQQFLNAHPSEIIFMRVMEEYKEKNPAAPFEELYIRYMDMYPDLFWKEVRLPTLGEARGKVIFFQNFKGSKWIGLPYGMMEISDYYSLPTLFNVPAKWTGDKKSLDTAIKNPNDKKLYLTHTSGAGIGVSPQVVAQLVNKQLLRYLEGTVTGRLGIIAMDFPGAKVIDRIIESNFPKEKEVIDTPTFKVFVV